MKCPCEECICIPICRHRKIPEISHKCELIYMYLWTYSRIEHRKRLKEAYIVLEKI